MWNVPAHNDAEACDLAKSATVAQLRHVLSTYVYDPVAQPDAPKVPPEGGDPRDHVSIVQRTRPVRHARECSVASGCDHRVSNQGGARCAVLAGNSDVTWLDSLVEVCNRSVGTIKSVSRRERFRIYWHLATDDAGGPAHAWLNGGPTLPQAMRDALMCDGIVKPLWTTGGRPINVGRAIYIVPPHTRRVVLDRDRTCRFPDCHCTTHLEVHHLNPFLAGGRTDTRDLAGMCSNHHDAHHRGEFTITGNADIPGDLIFCDHRGRVIPEAGIPNRPTGPPPAPPPGKRYAHPTGERFDARWLQFSDAPKRSPDNLEPAPA